MQAVIQAGGHQYNVSAGDLLKVDRLAGEPGDTVNFDKVLMVIGDQTRVGKPFVEGAKVAGVIRSQDRDPKVTIFKYKRRKNYKRTVGHRQPSTMVEISSIDV